MECKFKVGDKVALNNFGLQGIHGLSDIEMIKDSYDLYITRVFDVNSLSDTPSFNEPLWCVEVNKESINQFSLMQEYFNKKGI